jgi:hypothetical protein
MTLLPGLNGSTSPQRTHIADLAAQADQARLRRIERAWKAYDGDAPKPLRTERGEPDDNVRLDYARLIVDKGVSFLAGKGGVTIQVQDDSAAALVALDQAWPEERRHLDLHNLAVNGAVTGHAWIRLYETGRVQVLDPANVTAEWDGDDIEQATRLIVSWDTLDDQGLGVARRHVIEPDNPASPASWSITVQDTDEHGTWRTLRTHPWPHRYPPLVGCQNLPSPNTYYGAADLEPAVLDLLEQIEAVASDMRRLVRFHGHPTPIVFGEDSSRIQELDVSIGGMLCIPSETARLGQLQVAELGSSSTLYDVLKTALLETTRTPKIALGDTTNAGPVTGVALKVEYEPIIEKTETKRLTYGALLRQTAERVLDLTGHPGMGVSLSWPELTPSDPQGETASNEAELRMGVVSKQTVAEKRGHDWQQESQRIGDEAARGQARFDAGRLGPAGPYGGGA